MFTTLELARLRVILTQQIERDIDNDMQDGEDDWSSMTKIDAEILKKLREE